MRPRCRPSPRQPASAAMSGTSEERNSPPSPLVNSVGTECRVKVIDCGGCRSLGEHKITDGCGNYRGSSREREKNAALPPRWRFQILHIPRIGIRGVSKLFDEFREIRRTLRRILGEEARQNVNPAIFKSFQQLEHLGSRLVPLASPLLRGRLPAPCSPASPS